MADIRCPKCGRENPASLDVCQYCQTPLTSENTLRIGDKPTKKNTGELEPILPDWLQDVRKQARDSAEKDAAAADTMPKIQKAEPPDLLAGLASQSSNADDEDMPDWLAGLRPKPTEKPASPARPESDFFSQFDDNLIDSKSKPSEIASAGLPSQPAESSDRDELSEWFSKASEQPAEPFSLESDSESIDTGWAFRDEPAPSQETAAQPEEDLSWLRDLEAESKRTGELSSPKQDDWKFGFDLPAETGSSSQDDMSWLDHLGTPPASGPAKQEPSGQDEDLSWLHDLGSLPPAGEPSQSKEEDLSWLNAFSEPSAPPQNVPVPPASQDDLKWMDELGKGSEPSEQFSPTREQPSSEEDLDWLRDLQGKPGSFSSALDDSSPQKTIQPSELPKVPPFTPGRTGPLGDEADTGIPDWLKSATEEPSLPLGPQAFEQIRDDKATPDIPAAIAASSIFGAAIPPEEETPIPPQPEVPAGESAPLFSQDVDSIFSQDMPDWLKQSEPEAIEPAEDIGVHAEGGETLSPADLPSWVQAMRPVEAVISEAGPSVNDQPIEQQGPLAGLRGVIPVAAIGALRRPQPIPLTLQATADQQANAGILEQILIAETTSRPLVTTPVMASQQRLRWLIAGLILFVLGAVIFAGTQIMPVSPVLPPAASDVTNVVMNIADNAPVLVIVDYEPGLAGEMEAVSGPLLNQLVLLHNPYLSFLSTSPSGNALVERLLRNTDISRPDGTGYVAGQNYTNMGYLPGGDSGVAAFLQSPQAAIPNSPVLEFSEYAAILLLTDHADSARVWVEQLHVLKQSDPTIASQPLLAVSSAQTGPMLQPYFSSGQITGLINGLPVAARYESLNGARPGIARAYWDAFGVGMMMAVMLIVLGSLWSLYSGYRARHPEAAEE